MTNKHYTPTADPVYVPTEPGFLVNSWCGRQWYVPLEAVGRDYAEFLEQADNLASEAAKAQAELNREWWPSWFAEQCYAWSDIERLGAQVRRSTLLKTKKALDRRRSRSVEEFTEWGIRAPL